MSSGKEPPQGPPKEPSNIISPQQPEDETSKSQGGSNMIPDNTAETTNTAKASYRFPGGRTGMIVGGVAVGAAAVAVVVPMALGTIGFAAGGIAAGSVAAKLMSLAATTGYGGAVVAAAQSVGAAGVGAAATIVGAGAGAAGGVAIGGKLSGKKNGPDNPGSVDGSDDTGRAGGTTDKNTNTAEHIEEQADKGGSRSKMFEQNKNNDSYDEQNHKKNSKI